MKTHPVAELFPLLAGAELDHLVEDIRTHGLHEPIKTWNGVLIDGRNRLRACEIAGVAPRFEALSLADEYAVIEYIISANIHRRHLDPGQRAMIGEELRPPLEAAARDRKKAGQKNGGESRAAARGGKPEVLGPNVGSKHSHDGKVNRQIAKLMNTGHGSQSKAKKVKKDAPELAEKVLAGEIKLNAAYKETKRKAAHEEGRKQGRAEAQIDPSLLPLSQQQKLEKALKQEQTKLAAAFDQALQDKVKELIDELVLPQYNKEMAEARQIIEARRGLMTRKEYLLIASCLHPDQSASKERLNEAFVAFTKRELALCSEKEMPTTAPAIPRTYDEMMKRREEMKAKRRHQSNGVQQRTL